jgi:signal transduction histidine kinase/DNA-binding response OmpR family regulator
MHKILIVDDNGQNLYMLQVLLETNGYQVGLASNGVEALDLMHKNLPDMIISDILMPIMDGFNLCRNCKTDPQLKELPFVFYTATYTDPKDEAFALSLGADRFLVKPIAPDDLLTILEEVFRTHHAGEHPISPEPDQAEGEYYKEYSEILIHKLEQKTMQLELANKRLTSLYQASCNLLTVKSAAELVHCILVSIVKTAGYQQANYFSFDESQNTLSLLDAIGFSEETSTIFRDQLVFSLGEQRGLVGLVAQNGQTLNVADTSADLRWVTLDPAIQSALFIPVRYEISLLGVLALFSVEKDAFTEEDEHNITALANSLAITFENRRIEEEIRQLNVQLEQRVTERTAQLENSNKELEAFAYSVSHDLRAPLRAIDGFSHMLLEDEADKLDAKGLDLLGKVSANARKMDKLITDLLALSRVSRSELRFYPIDMTTTADSVYYEITSAEVQKKFTFSVSPLPDVQADPVLLRQVWINLISNAVKYTLPKEERRIQISGRIEGDMNIYAIQDNGVGFDPRYTHKLFGVFQRLHSPDKYEGNGVGLAIVKRIIQLHGGQVWGEGVPDQGATFSFSLPRRQDQ